MSDEQKRINVVARRPMTGQDWERIRLYNSLAEHGYGHPPGLLNDLQKTFGSSITAGKFIDLEGTQVVDDVGVIYSYDDEGYKFNINMFPPGTEVLIIQIKPDPWRDN